MFAVLRGYNADLGTVFSKDKSLRMCAGMDIYMEKKVDVNYKKVCNNRELSQAKIRNYIEQQ